MKLRVTPLCKEKGQDYELRNYYAQPPANYKHAFSADQRVVIEMSYFVNGMDKCDDNGVTKRVEAESRYNLQSLVTIRSQNRVFAPLRFSFVIKEQTKTYVSPMQRQYRESQRTKQSKDTQHPEWTKKLKHLLSDLRFSQLLHPQNQLALTAHLHRII